MSQRPDNYTAPAETGVAANRREEIVQAAAILFRRKGFDATSMQDIAEAVGMLKGSLYYHFTSKEELLYEVVNRGVDRLLSGAEPIFARQDLGPREKLRQLVRYHMLHLGRGTQSLVIASYEADKLEPAHREAYVAKRDRYESFLRQTIAEGIARGELAPVDVKLAALAILGMCNWFIQWYRPTGPYTPEYIADYFSSLVCDRLLAQPAAEHGGGAEPGALRDQGNG